MTIKRQVEYLDVLGGGRIVNVSGAYRITTPTRKSLEKVCDVLHIGLTSDGAKNLDGEEFVFIKTNEGILLKPLRDAIRDQALSGLMSLSGSSLKSITVDELNRIFSESD